MRIVVTGASGVLGSVLVPRLLDRGFDLLLVGRDLAAMTSKFPGAECCDYEQLAGRMAGADSVLHLAVVNSDAEASLEQYMDVNAALPARVAQQAAAAGIGRFIYISSLHALDPKRNHPYAVSKRAGQAGLLEVNGIDVVTVYLPAVHTGRWNGRWAFINSLPGLPKRMVEAVLKAFKPTVDIDVLTATVIDVLESPSPAPELVITNGQANNRFYHFVRRTADIAAALAIVILLWWALLAVWIAVRATSQGPGIFAQERVGRRGAVFTCYKFRTMHVGTRQAATHELTQASVTSVGHGLRRTKLDELPQLWNLLKGEMTLVGPRPCLPSQTELIEIRKSAGVLELRPGITGLAQVNGIDMSLPLDLVVYDQRYLAMQGLIFDLKVLAFTLLGRGGGDRLGS